MNHTIIADASYCPHTGAGGYGFWYASPKAKYGGEGELKNPVTSSCAAEMMAVINALHHACMNGFIEEKDDVLLQTDCKDAILVMRGGRIIHNADERKAKEHLQNLERSFKLRLRYRYVPGHTDGRTARTATNNICDQKARWHMRNMRHRLNVHKLKDMLNER